MAPRKVSALSPAPAFRFDAAALRRRAHVFDCLLGSPAEAVATANCRRELSTNQPGGREPIFSVFDNLLTAAEASVIKIKRGGIAMSLTATKEPSRKPWPSRSAVSCRFRRCGAEMDSSERALKRRGTSGKLGHSDFTCRDRDRQQTRGHRLATHSSRLRCDRSQWQSDRSVGQTRGDLRTHW